MKENQYWFGTQKKEVMTLHGGYDSEGKAIAALKHLTDYHKVSDVFEAPDAHHASLVAGGLITKIKIQTCLIARNVEVECPHCNVIQDGFFGNPAGAQFVCSDCKKPYLIHPEADIEHR